MADDPPGVERCIEALAAAVLALHDCGETDIDIIKALRGLTYVTSRHGVEYLTKQLDAYLATQADKDKP